MNCFKSLDWDMRVCVHCVLTCQSGSSIGKVALLKIMNYCSDFVCLACTPCLTSCVISNVAITCALILAVLGRGLEH